MTDELYSQMVERLTPALPINGVSAVATVNLLMPLIREHSAEVWEAGFTKAGRLILGMDHEEWPPTPNPWRGDS